MNMINARLVCIILGAIFILVGLLGFTPNPLVSETGLFAVNTAHNLVHILAGGVFIGGALIITGHESKVLKAMGLGGIAVTLINFLAENDTMLWIIQANEADRWLHLVLALAVLATGFIFKDSQSQCRPRNKYSATRA